MTDIDIEIESKLKAYRDEKQIFNIGALGTVLVITRKADTLGFPLQPDSLITKGGGQVSGLSGRAINKILQSHGVSNQVGTESRRTSRGTINLAKDYAEWLNSLNNRGVAKLAKIEIWWVDRFVDYFNTEPFKLNYDQAKTLVMVLRDLLDQAIDRQRKTPGKTYVGTVLQHLIGAKLELALPDTDVSHNGASVADSVSERSGDFVIDDAIIHCTTAPSRELIQKCKMNLQCGKRPIILTLNRMIGAAEGLAEELNVEGRIEMMDALQFLAANLYEMSLFKASQRKITIEKLVQKYNEIVNEYESDASLRIEIG
jgi:hypothetical protein